MYLGWLRVLGWLAGRRPRRRQAGPPDPADDVGEPAGHRDQDPVAHNVPSVSRLVTPATRLSATDAKDVGARFRPPERYGIPIRQDGPARSSSLWRYRHEDPSVSGPAAAARAGGRGGSRSALGRGQP